MNRQTGETKLKGHELEISLQEMVSPPLDASYYLLVHERGKGGMLLCCPTEHLILAQNLLTSFNFLCYAYTLAIRAHERPVRRQVEMKAGIENVAVPLFPGNF